MPGSRSSLLTHLALAVAHKSDGKVLTGDEHFGGLPETLWIGSSWLLELKA